LTVLSIHHPVHDNKQDGEVIIQVIYDNYPANADFTGDWGFSCLIEGKEKTILFDTGTKPWIFRQHPDKMNIHVHDIDVIVISHNHGDHTGGLPVLIEQKISVPVYIPYSVRDAFTGHYPELRPRVIPVTEPIEICEGVFLSGEMGNRIKEQFLILETARGLVVITGCSHPGIERILNKTREISSAPIHLVMGGFHMLNYNAGEIEKTIDHFKRLQVYKCAPSHCTGKAAIELFKDTYQQNFIRLGAGRIVKIPSVERP
jgi:7,8-dihydropterin-6-yl-methyl-4-(beta-D-ribofuranosyl)aminobenzene 5'-phosphate synthase